MIRRSDIDVNELLLKIDNNNYVEKCSLFVWGVLIYALSFSVFFSSHDIVTGGSTGLSIIINNIFGIDMSLFVFIFSVIMLAVGYITLGKYYTMKSVFGVILLPIFMKFTSIFNLFINLDNVSLFLISFYGGIFMGLGNGIIIRSGFSVGGFQTIYQIFYKYFGLSIGKSSLIINGVVVLLSVYFFGVTNMLYAIVALYISAVVSDKVMLETSTSKTFFIVTKKYKDINEYIVDILGHGATIMDARGGYKNEKGKILMCNVPTRKYYHTKEVIQNIDKDAFFVITDTYEIYGGV